MVNKLPCLYEFIHSTKTGDRNINLFKAINHLRRYNQTASIDEITQEALLINKTFESPLSEHEVSVVCKHVLAKKYKTSCWKFKKHCKHCRYGEFHKRFRNSKPKYWKHINENNRLINIKTIPDDCYYPWDIVDTEKLHDIIIEDGDEKKILTKEEQKIKIELFREQMGIPIAIDKTVKSYGIPIGDKAKREWEKFKKKENN